PRPSQPRFRDGVCVPLTLFRHHRLSRDETALPEGTARVPAVSGACMMLPAAIYRAIGGMDEGYFLHVEDLDLCLRLHRAGIPTYFVPHVEAVHHASTSRAHPLLIEWHKVRGLLRYFGLHYGRLRWLPVLALLATAIFGRLGLRAAKSLWRPAG
ncbi:MAG: glycosyltransferase, partial [Rhodospirillales bacterium]|nr:glycosyltransferase [Rhodospirillales bacterium]